MAAISPLLLQLRLRLMNRIGRVDKWGVTIYGMLLANALIPLILNFGNRVRPSKRMQSEGTFPLLSVHEPAFFVNLVTSKPEKRRELGALDLV